VTSLIRISRAAEKVVEQMRFDHFERAYDVTLLIVSGLLQKGDHHG